MADVASSRRVGAHPIVFCLVLTAAACAGPAADFDGRLPADATRVWVGPEYYANRLQDWRLANGRIESVEGRTGKPMRTLHLLTRTLGTTPAAARLSVRTGPMEPGERHEDTWSGFLIGAGGPDVDYRITALVHHWPSADGGLIVAWDGTGRIVVRDNSTSAGVNGPNPNIPVSAWPEITPEAAEAFGDGPSEVELAVEVEPAGDRYRLTVRAADLAGREVARSTYAGIAPGQVAGNVALVSHRSPEPNGPGYWFDRWQVSGPLVESHDERAVGPVIGTLYTLGRGVLKMTAQLAPVGAADGREAVLEVERGGRWEEVARGAIAPLSYTAHFRAEHWTGDRDVPYRVGYELLTADGLRRYDYSGTIRAVPAADEEFVLGTLNCHHISGGDGEWNGSHFWYPHTELTAAVAHHDPDMLFFSGDQIYESGLEGVERQPLERAALDYLNHWNRFLLAFGDLTRDRPTVTIPDDHDVYHGNIWGNGGVREPGNATLQDRGGYTMPVEWVNAVHRTQVAHLPDPDDPTPLDNGISVYYTRLDYAGLSFAILADRMWKSPPAIVVPAGGIVNGWPQNPRFSPRTESDVPGAVLLGERQERFLANWAVDYSGGAWMKVVLSQTPFVNVATLPPGETSGAVIPSLPIPEPGEYFEGERQAADMDSNGWPKTPRDRAVRAMRRGFAFHIAGDQHLGSFTRYGVDMWGDAGYAFVIPSIANIWPRRWYPDEPGENRPEGAPRYTGDYLDGFGNRMTVLAIANPTKVPVEPTRLYQRAPGYGIVRFRRADRTIVTEAWPRWAEPTAPDAAQYPGWPITVRQQDNYDRPAAAWLPTVEVNGMVDPVVEVRDERSGEAIYAIRIQGTTFRPRVFERGGTYTLLVGEPGTDRVRTIAGVVPTTDESTVIRVSLSGS